MIYQKKLKEELIGYLTAKYLVFRLFQFLSLAENFFQEPVTTIAGFFHVTFGSDDYQLLFRVANKRSKTRKMKNVDSRSNVKLSSQWLYISVTCKLKNSITII